MKKIRFRINVCNRELFTNGAFSCFLRQFSNRGIYGLTLKSGRGVLSFCSRLKKKTVQLTSEACGGLLAHPLQPLSPRVCSKLFPRHQPFICEKFLRSDSLNDLIFNPKFANINFPHVRKQSRTEKVSHFSATEHFFFLSLEGLYCRPDILYYIILFKQYILLI